MIVTDVQVSADDKRVESIMVLTDDGEQLTMRLGDEMEPAIWGPSHLLSHADLGESLGLKIGVTRQEKDLFGQPYRETTAPDGQVKSKAREHKDWLGNEYTESIGGPGQTKHTTQTRRNWFGRKYRETE